MGEELTDFLLLKTPVPCSSKKRVQDVLGSCCVDAVRGDSARRSCCKSCGCWECWMEEEKVDERYKRRGKI
jgi:hypothetical protein